MMSNPRVSAAISGIGIIAVGWGMFSADEAPSTALLTLEWVLLVGCVLGLIGSLIRMGSGR